MAAKKFKKIAQGSTSFQRSRLYATEDHLLQVVGSYSEEYRRFYYKDIKGALIQDDTLKTRVCAGFLIALIIICVLCFVRGSDIAIGFGVFFSVVTFVVMLAVLPTLLTGGYASLFLVTSVQHEKVAAVSGRRKARKVIFQIQDRLVELGHAEPMYGDPKPTTRTTETVA